MPRKAVVVALVGLFLLAGRSRAAEIPVATATGVVEKAGKDSLTFQPRLANGEFAKGVVLKVTGTSKITILGTRMQGRRVILTQRQAEAKDLKKGQKVAVIYVRGKEGDMLLAAVVQPVS
jgi:hypothetical protein